MRPTIIASLLFPLCMVACKSKDKKANEPAAATEEPGKPRPMECYRYAGPLDTIILKMNHIGDSLSGLLIYRLHEKDQNVGSVDGYMKGDILIARYTFMSESITSYRQVAFKKENDYFIEGFGETVTNGPSVSFKNIDSLQFNKEIRLTPIECQE